MTYYLHMADHPWMQPLHTVPFHRIPWDGGPNYTSRYPEDDEGVHDGTWTYTKVISPDLGKWNQGVKAVLRINSFGSLSRWAGRSNRARKATGYSLRVELNRMSIRICDARCLSVRDAKAHANRIQLKDALRTLLRKVYNKNRARCVFDASGTPLLSTFDDLYGWRDGLRSAHYYDIDPVDHYRDRAVHHTEMWGSGYCAGSVPAERTDFAATLVPWT